jgi:hypothetical protein
MGATINKIDSKNSKKSFENSILGKNMFFGKIRPQKIQ